MPANTPPSPLRFVLRSLQPFRGWLLAQTINATFWSIHVVISPYLMKVLLNTLVDLPRVHAYEALLKPCVMFMAFEVAIPISHRIHDFIWYHVRAPLRKELVSSLMHRMMFHAHQLYMDHFAGGLGNRIKDAMTKVPRLVETIIDRFYSDSLSLLFGIMMLSYVSPYFGLGLVIWAGFCMFVAFKIARHARNLSKNTSEAKTNFVGNVVDVFGNMMNVRLFARRKYEERYQKRYVNQYVTAYGKEKIFWLKVFLLQGYSFLLYQSACLWVLAFLYQRGMVTAGDFALVLTLNVRIVHMMWNLAQDVGDFSENMGVVDQGLKIALQPFAITDVANAPPLKVAKGAISFNKVDFHYPKAPNLFEQLSVQLKANQKVGLVGYSGGGKSSFINLILRLFDVQGGHILLDDQDVSKVTQDSLRSQIGMIPQDPSLFHRTLMENIRYGKADATDEEVMEAAKKAFAHEFIMKMPDGYQSLVGERGVKLSGGQRQRIAIARAFLKNAPILILDEATSQLDSITEVQIQESLWELMKGKTTLVVAHRLSTLLKMDRILVFEQGKIVQDGTHQELEKQKGLYQLLWKEQVGGFINDETH